jgi:dihydroorotase
MGVVGIECAFSIMYTEFVKKGIITMERLLELMCYNPKKRFGISDENSYTVFDLDYKSKISPDSFLSMGKKTPFEGREAYGKCLLTVCNGKVAYKED